MDPLENLWLFFFKATQLSEKIIQQLRYKLLLTLVEQ